ncbi:DUF3105 domain-containing protein [Sorangium sp. So ce176]|uniref:DUF3105 domain-containing protein n=1 Tax=Sorangium sp. So ce176 TaxID=3133286 RepID=UPI003F60039E
MTMTDMGVLSCQDGDAERAASGTADQHTALIHAHERPRLAPSVELIGEMKGTGFKDRQWLVQRDGQFIQLTELLYRIAECADGQRTHEAIAERVTASTPWLVTADNVRELIQTKLVPSGLMAPAAGAVAPRGGVPGNGEPRSSLRLKFRKQVIGPHGIEPIAAALQVLYARPILIPVLVAAAITHGWLYFVHGVAGSFLDLFYRPWALLIVMGVMVVSSVFHEFGHASALRYGGGKARGMGVGLYLVYPAFYTDVSDSYRLSRVARVRTDLGGFYFHLIFAMGIMAVYLVTRQEFLLVVVVLINGNIGHQLLPYVRMDGYWALADITGIPDFFSQMGPFVASLFPRLKPGVSRLPPLKPWVRRVFIVYTLLVVPFLALLSFSLVEYLPRLLKTTWFSLVYQMRLFSIAWGEGTFAVMVVSSLNMLLLALMAFGGMYMFYSIIGGYLKSIWNWSKSKPIRRPAGAAAVAALFGVIGLLWAPQVRSLDTSPPRGVKRFAVPQRNEVRGPVVYKQNPPVGGDHAPEWQNCGFYDAPVLNEHAVHSMEHGAVWITYRPDLPKHEIDTLRALARGQPYVLVSPYANLPAPVVASAWGRQLHLLSTEDARIDQFLRAFRNGTQAPESAGPCTGGVGTPRR